MKWFKAHHGWRGGKRGRVFLNKLQMCVLLRWSLSTQILARSSYGIHRTTSRATEMAQRIWCPGEDPLKCYFCCSIFIVKSLSRVRLFATLWTVAHQAPQSMGFSRQEYWSGLPFPSPGDLSDPGIEPRSPALRADTLTSEPRGKPIYSAGGHMEEGGLPIPGANLFLKHRLRPKFWLELLL